jgi:hypothetical protein
LLSINRKHTAEILLLETLERLDNLLGMRTPRAVKQNRLVIHLVAGSPEKNG